MNILELGYLDVGNYIHGILNARTHELEHKAKSRRENYCRGGGKTIEPIWIGCDWLALFLGTLQRGEESLVGGMF